MNNLAMIFPIRPNFVEQIFDGSKNMEFRTKLPKDLKPGMKVYIYETLGRRHEEKECGYIVRKWTDGSGMIVGEFTVERVYNLFLDLWQFCDNLVNSNVVGTQEGALTLLKEQGYNKHKYAFEITNVVKYDRFEDKKGFGTKQWIDLCEFNRKGYNKCGGCNYYSDNLESGCNTLETYCSKPTSPIPKEDFAGWNTVKDYYDKEYAGYMPFELFIEVGNKNNFETNNGFNLHIKAPPQAPIYVVEREEK